MNETITDIGLKSYDDVEGVLDRFVIEKLLKSADFQDGQSFETLVDDCFVHVTEIDGTSPHWNSYERKSNEVSKINVPAYLLIAHSFLHSL